MRNKVERTSILLRTEAQRVHAIKHIKSLPLDNDKPVEILTREQVRTISLDQNSYYRWRVGQIAEDGWFEGRQYPHQVWHEYCGRYIMPEQIIDKFGKTRSKWIDLPGGGQTIISTTMLEKKCMADFITMVEVFGAELGVRFTANRNDISQ